MLALTSWRVVLLPNTSRAIIQPARTTSGNNQTIVCEKWAAATKERKVRQISLRTIIGRTCLLGSLLFGPTIAMAEYNVNDALEAYDSANPNDRKTWELVFGNTQNGINWANSVLFYRKQQPLYCPPDNFALTGPQVVEMLRELATSKPKLATVPYGFAILLALQSRYPCGGSQ
jgi:hypothetical protein